MTKRREPSRRTRPLRIWAGVCVAVASLATGCGGGISNENESGGQRPLSFDYFQHCINPIFLERLPIVGTNTTNTCAGSGCHDSVNGTGGAFRVIPTAQTIDLASSPAPEVIRASDMFRNYYSAQGEVVLTAISQSRLLTKPRVQDVLHGGGLIFETNADPFVQRIIYWMSHPMATGQSEFGLSPAVDHTTTPATCRTQ